MNEEKFKAKVDSLLKKKDLTKNRILRQEYIDLISMVRESEIIYQKYNLFLDSLLMEVKDDVSITEWEENSKLSHEYLELIKESLPDVYKSQIELKKVLDSKFKQSIENNRLVINANNKIVMYTKEIFGSTFSIILNENYSEAVINALIEITKTISTLKIPFLTPVFLALDISNFTKNNIKTADRVLDDIELQKAVFTSINEGYSAIMINYKKE